MLLGSLTAALVQLASVLILSRLLPPDDFGLIAMVAVFVLLGNLLRDFGLPLAALQEVNLSHQQASNLFWMNALLAFGSGLGLALAAPLLSGLFDEPRLMHVAPAMGLVTFVTGLGAQLQVQLARRLRYTALAWSEVASQVTGLAIGASLALAGAGYWALVGQYLASACSLVGLRWAAARFVPARFRRGFGSQRLFKSGAEYGVAHLLTFAQNNVDTFVIGVRLGAGPLGLYNRAFQLITMPAVRLTAPLTQVVVPILNARSAGRGWVGPLLRLQVSVGGGMILLFSVAAGVADVLIPLALGDGWEGSVRVFKILAIGACASALSNISYWGFIVNQQGRELLRYNLVSKPAAIGCILAGSLFGLEGVAWGYTAGLFVSWPLNLIWLARTAGLPGWRFFGNGMFLLVSGVAAGLIASLPIRIEIASNEWVQMVCGSVMGIATMLLFTLAPRSSRSVAMSSLSEIVPLLKRSRS